MRVHDPIDLLEIQIACSMLQNEAQMRYLTSPKLNLKRIRRILVGAFKELEGLKVPESQAQCPNNWMHVMCRCISPTHDEMVHHDEIAHQHETATGRTRGRRAGRGRRRTPATPMVGH